MKKIIVVMACIMQFGAGVAYADEFDGIGAFVGGATSGVVVGIEPKYTAQTTTGYVMHLVTTTGLLVAAPPVAIVYVGLCSLVNGIKRTIAVSKIKKQKNNS